MKTWISSSPLRFRNALGPVLAALVLGSPGLASAQPLGPTPVDEGLSVPPGQAAQEPAPPATEPADATPPVATGKPAMETPPPAPSVPIRATGILWSSVFATQGVQSFGLPTTVAPTAAINPALFRDRDDPLLSFQIQQTRLGLVVGEPSPFRGVLEVDFVHFDQSSPTVQAFPRVRIALLEWTFHENHKLFVGQTWDLFGNSTGPQPQLLSHSFNLVGTLFQAGNIGFMRHQAGWMGTFGPVELASAIGAQGANSGPVYNNVEQSFTPTGSARALYRLPDKAGVLGVSGIATGLRFTNATGDREERRLAAGGELFADLTFGPLNLHSEVYLARNLANTGALNLGQGRFGTDVADAGGYLSAKLTFGEHAVTAMAGAAAVLNPSDVIPGYTPATATAPVAPNTAAGPGMLHNMTAHVGYWYSPLKGLSFVVEPYVYGTKFRLDPADAAALPERNVSWGGSLGAMYQF